MAEIKEKVDVLKRAQLFESISDATLERIADISEYRHYDEGDSVYQMGDEANYAYVLVSGRIRFTLGVGNRPGSSGGSIMTSRMVVGWAALVDAHPRRVATAVCLEPSTLLAIDGAMLLQILEQNTAAGFLIMRRLAAMIARNFLE